MKESKTGIFVIVGIVLVLASTIFFALMLAKPKFNYDIQTFPEGEKEEQPLQLTVENNSVNFSFSFTTGEGEVQTALLQNGYKLKTELLFLTPSNELIIKLRSSVNKTEEIEKYFLYEISGKITNLDPKEYKIRVEDAYGNLIDWKMIELRKKGGSGDVKVPKEWKWCKEDSDCIPVSCSCYCSGNGFPYQDIVNMKFVELWYKKQNCPMPKECSEVLCYPLNKAVCNNGVCEVIEISK
jgi:hypothetical protein